MKKLYPLIIAFLLCASTLSAQLVEVVPNVGFSAQGLFLNGDILYIGKLNDIRRIDITEESPTLEIFSTSINQSFYMVLYVNDFYVSAGGPSDYRIVKLDFANPNDPPVNVTFQDGYLGAVRVMLLVGDDLYYTGPNIDTLFRMDLSQATPSAEVVYSGIDLNNAIALYGNDMYIAEYKNPGKLYKLDITDPSATPIELASGLETPYDMEFLGDELYISLNTGDKIVKTDVTQLPLVMEDVVVALEPRDMVFDGNELYVINGINSNIISKVDVSTLSVADVSQDERIVLYPNPTEDLLYLKNLSSQENYTIYDAIGRTLMLGKIEPNNSIDVSSLATGRYFIRIGDSFPLNFVKR
ncbi:T9SS type A sorting domain-containing protein [Psychroserpens sp. Hel_I_66]|uniref:T9SS type A sorting domain-containing protein n=1 Tax=Psychroserpens sp. Hel_I_66 TaxID=1250004 RepID=UPI0006478A0C|nr:T9SS type A sorting domain-containing protein [Psychroserpens sp. Hel_I_66]